MINCNPETVSTDPDTSDRLYFEPLTAEDVLEIVTREKSRGELKGVIVQLGGQTPLKLARGLEAAGYRIMGTPFDAVDVAASEVALAGGEIRAVNGVGIKRIVSTLVADQTDQGEPARVDDLFQCLARDRIGLILSHAASAGQGGEGVHDVFARHG